MRSGYSFPLRPAAWLLMAGAVWFAPGCARQDTAPAADGSAAASVPGKKRYPLRGEVVAVNSDRRTLTITHEEIKGFMPAMTMEFQVARGDLENARPGQRIRAELVQRGPDFSLEKIWPDDTATTHALSAAANALAQDTAMRGKEAYREVGEILPEFTLLDQDGRAVSPGRFRGRQVVLNFIFTRCPVATMCPAATLRMISLQKAAREAGVTNLELVSVSLDPEFDTPGVLKEYAEARGIDTANFSFLTGPDLAVRHLLAQLGVLREFEGATIKHTLATVLISAEGRISYRVDGSAWAVGDFVGHLKKG